MLSEPLRPGGLGDHSEDTRLIDVGDVLEDRYEIVTAIGAGSFGLVFRARDRLERQDVAIKTLLPGALGRRELVERFAREAAVCTLLRHENMPELLHCGQIVREGQRVPYMVFELVRGHTLGDVVEERGPLDLWEASALLAQVCDCLHHAHVAGILHRDLKPDNLLVVAPEASRTAMSSVGGRARRLGIPNPGGTAFSELTGHRVKVLDWGLSKMLGQRGREFEALTMEGMVPGTSQYMSPEQVLGDPDIDFRSDLYAVSMLIYRCTTGQPPFDGTRAAEIALKHVTEPLPPLPSPWDRHLLAEVYERGAAKDRERRYRDAAAMATALRRALKDPRPDAKKEGLWSRLFHRAARGTR